MDEKCPHKWDDLKVAMTRARRIAYRRCRWCGAVEIVNEPEDFETSNAE